jgi:hypothetical protein
MTDARPATRKASVRHRRSPNRPRRRVRAIELLRGLWGLTLLSAPATVLGSLGLRTGARATAVSRILGARHLTQATLSGVDPSPELLAAGVWVDRVHATTAIALAAVDAGRRRAALIDAGMAAGWAAFGRHDLAAGHCPPRRHELRRDQLATWLLAHLPGGRGLLSVAALTRSTNLPARSSTPDQKVR